jgi:ElaB/YqjD/DUF883 family membrane-anchored ribosome-binding protein
MATTIKKLNKGTDADDLSAQVETLRDDIVDLTQMIADLGKSKGYEAASAAIAKATDAREKVSDQAEAARQQALALQGQANDFVHKQPATALGIAAGLGFLIGFLGARK